MATGLPTQKKRTRRAGSDSWQLPWIKAVRGTTDDCYDCPECGLDRPTGREISVAMKSRHLKAISSVIVIGSRHSRSHGFKQLESRQMPWQKRERLVILIYELHPKNALPPLQKLAFQLYHEEKPRPSVSVQAWCTRCTRCTHCTLCTWCMSPIFVRLSEAMKVAKLTALDTLSTASQ